MEFLVKIELFSVCWKASLATLRCCKIKNETVMKRAQHKTAHNIAVYFLENKKLSFRLIEVKYAVKLDHLLLFLYLKNKN